MKNMKHPAFLIGVVSIIVLIIGIGLKIYAYRFGDYVIYFSVFLGAIHWLWSIIDVSKRTDLKGEQKVFWLIAVVAAPVIGGMLFYTMHQRAGKIVT